MRPIKFKQIAVDSNHLYGLDDDGEVWFRKSIPYNGITPSHQVKKEDDTIWKPLAMKAYVAPRKSDTDPKEIPVAPEEVIRQGESKLVSIVVEGQNNDFTNDIG